MTTRILHIFFFYLLVACGSKQSTSKLGWGHLSGIGQQNLVFAKPTDRIAICGINPEVTTWAVLTWADAIGRASALSGNIVSCDATGATYTVNVTTTNGGGAPAWTSGTDVTVNTASMDSSPSQFYRAILLHEIGHSWGMCDQYADMGNCDPGNSSQLDNSSVMGATNENKQQLTADDLEGMKALAARPDVGSAAAWQGSSAVLQNPIAPPNVLQQSGNSATGNQGNLPNTAVYPQNANPPSQQVRPPTTFPMQYYQQGSNVAFPQLILMILASLIR